MSFLIICLASLAFYISRPKYDGLVLREIVSEIKNQKMIRYAAWLFLLIGVLLEINIWGIATGLTFSFFTFTLFISCFILFDRLSIKGTPIILLVSLFASIIRQLY